MSYVTVTTSTATIQVTANNSATINVAGAATATVNQDQSVLVTTPTLQGVQSISSPDFVQFNTAAVATGGIGRLKWNSTDNTLDLGLPTSVTLQIGQEHLLYVSNVSGVTLPEGAAVYVTGATGNRTTVALADNDASAMAAHNTVGVVTTAGGIANNQRGYVTLFGMVRDIDTSAWADGDQLWLSSTPGVYTNVEPISPKRRVRIGWVVRSQQSVGSILVDVSIGLSLGELEDVKITNPQNGDRLTYQASTGLWVNTPA